MRLCSVYLVRPIAILPLASRYKYGLSLQRSHHECEAIQTCLCTMTYSGGWTRPIVRLDKYFGAYLGPPYQRASYIAMIPDR